MNKKRSKAWYKKLKSLKFFFAIFLPLLIILVGTLFTVNNWEIKKDKQTLIERESAIGKINKLNIQTILSSVSTDLKVIKDSTILNDYVNNPTTHTLTDLNKMFMRFSKTKTIYEQLRFINTQGKEIARVDYNDGNGYIAEGKQLLDKSTSESFKGTSDLKPEEIYISQFDLNALNGKIEEPIKPIIRFGVPILNSTGDKSGVLIFNYLGQDILDKITENMKENRNFNIELLNAEGFFLKSIDERNDWSFMYDNNKNTSFKSENKDVWDIISSNESGQLEDNKNIYYYDTIYPLANIREKKDANFTHANGSIYWKTIISYPIEQFSFIKSLGANGFLGIGFIFFIIILMCSAVITYIVSKRQEALTRIKAAGNVFDNSKEAILITNSETRITYINKAFLDITGYKEQEVLNVKTSAFKSGKHDREFYKTMWQSIGVYGNWQGEIWDRKKNGQLYPKWLNILKIKSEDDKDIQYVGIFEDLTLLKEKEKSINKLKNYDRLTSLPNLTLVKQLIRKKISENSNNIDYKYSLVSLIITNYDIERGSVGLKKADYLIINILEKIKNHIKDNFIMGSPGKNEFIVLLEYNKGDNVIFEFVNNVLSEFKNSFVIDEEEIYVKLAMGVASYDDYSDDLELIIDNANIARAYSSEQIESNAQFYTPDLKEKYLEDIKIKQLLRKALEKGELYLNYQPQVDLKSTQIVGTEALIRWESPELGDVSPVRFIPIAEKTGLILEIGEWVLDEALRQNKMWREQNINPILMSVNISPVQFKKVDIFKLIKKKLSKYELLGNSLEIEITEGVLLGNDPGLMKQLGNINDIGVKLAMDDFGTGYSSLSYLRKFKFDKIKIDREFIKDYPEYDDGTIAKTIINLSKSLDIKVIAEGAETERQIDFLKENKCDQVQGYYYSPPVSPEEFIKLIRKENI